MNARYLLTCECGQSNPIELRQAGQTVRCRCGRELQAPTLRGMRQLPPAPEERATKSRSSGGWNAIQGAIFAVGALIFVVGLVITGYNYWVYKQIPHLEASQDDIGVDLTQIEESPPDKLLDLWAMVLQHGIGDHASSPFVVTRDASRKFRNWCFIGGGTALAGILVALTSLLVSSPPPSRRPPPKLNA